jgi:hypothetical protein
VVGNKVSQRSLAGRLDRANNMLDTVKIKTYFGHEDKLAAEAVVRIGIIVVNLGDGHVRLVTEIANSRNFGFCLQPRHEATRNSGNELDMIR